MRIGTWNMDGKSSTGSTELLLAQDCDVLLLTEVPAAWSLEGYTVTPAGESMLPDGKQWAAVASRRPLRPCLVPHGASTGAVIDGVTYVCSVLPWAGSGGDHPWDGDDHPSRVAATLEALRPFLAAQADLVWGGDWNHALHGPERAGSSRGRADLLQLLLDLGLGVATSELAHALPGLRSIDHVAARLPTQRAERVVAELGHRRLSDHDLSVVDLDVRTF